MNAAPLAGAARTSSPAALRVVPALSTEPPALGRDWGSGRSGDREAGTGARYVQGALALRLDEAVDPLFGPQRTGSSELPEIDSWARQVVQAALEVAEGTRPAEQLVRRVAPRVRERLARRGVLARRVGRPTGTRAHLRRMLLSSPADGVVEGSSVVVLGGRIRALAVRFEGVDGRWVLTVWEQG